MSLFYLSLLFVCLRIFYQGSKFQYPRLRSWEISNLLSSLLRVVSVVLIALIFARMLLVGISGLQMFQALCFGAFPFITWMAHKRKLSVAEWIVSLVVTTSLLEMDLVLGDWEAVKLLGSFLSTSMILEITTRGILERLFYAKIPGKMTWVGVFFILTGIILWALELLGFQIPLFYAMIH